MIEESSLTDTGFPLCEKVKAEQRILVYDSVVLVLVFVGLSSRSSSSSSVGGLVGSGVAMAENPVVHGLAGAALLSWAGGREMGGTRGRIGRVRWA